MSFCEISPRIPQGISIRIAQGIRPKIPQGIPLGISQRMPPGIPQVLEILQFEISP